MRLRDIAWRSVGVGLVGIAAVLRVIARPETQNLLSLAALFLILLGLVLIVQGRRVPAAMRVECSRHRLLPQAIRDRRRRPTGERNS